MQTFTVPQSRCTIQQSVAASNSYVVLGFSNSAGLHMGTEFEFCGNLEEAEEKALELRQFGYAVRIVEPGSFR